jgi:endonuclease/exonuclease/phosphatase family metal-dependent hydrolase
MKRIKNLLSYLILAANILFAGVMLLTAYSPYFSPMQHPYLSLTGLVFPLFVIINLLFIPVWIVMRRARFLWLSVIAFLLCMGQVHTYCPVNFRTPVDELPEGSIKLLSYNIMGFDGASKRKGNNPILNYLKASGADILCLQEYNTIDAPNFLSRKEVDEALDMYPYRNILPVGTQKGYTNQLACYSKFPILSARKIDYHSEYNGSIVYELQLGDDTLTLINNHLESNRLTKADKAMYERMLALSEPERKERAEQMKSGAKLLAGKLIEATRIRAAQVDSVAKTIAANRHPYLLVCGDFNDTPISYTHRVLKQGLNDAFVDTGCGLGISFNQNKFYFRIDHILTGKRWKAYDCTVDTSIKDSDHYPIWCYLSKAY